MAFSFRASPEVQAALAELMDRWRCNRTQALSRAVLEVAGRPLDAVGVEVPPEPKLTPGKALDKPQSVSFTKYRRTIPKPEWKNG